jgi:hypothetical protein
VLVSVEPGKNQDVVAALRQVAGVTQAHACWGQPDIFTYIEVDDDRAMADTVLVTIHHPGRPDDRNPPRGAGVSAATPTSGAQGPEGRH